MPTGQSRERFPRAPSICQERGERVPVLMRWTNGRDEEEGYDIEHPGLQPFFLSSRDVVGDFWPWRTLMAFAAAHAAADMLRGLTGSPESAREPAAASEPAEAPQAAPEPASGGSGRPRQIRRPRRMDGGHLKRD